METSPRGRPWFYSVACLLLFVAAIGRYWVYDRTETVPNNPESFRLSRSIAETGQFANPFTALDTGSSAHMGPAFPAVVALLIRVLGEGTAGMYAVKWTATVVLAGQLALFPFFSRALGMGELNGFIAACIWIAAKVGISGAGAHQLVPMFGWESFYAAFLLALVTCSFRRYLDSSEHDSNRLAWLMGLLVGASLLTSPSVVIVVVGLFGLLLWKSKLGIFQRSPLVFILLSAVVVTPWIIRNYLVFHRFIFVRDNLGLELSVSNNDCAAFGIAQNIDNGCFAKVHPNVNSDEAKKVLAYGEPKYNDLKLRDALHWIKTHPAGFSSLCALRFAAFWMPPAGGPRYSLLGKGRRLERIFVSAMTVLSLPGLFILYSRDKVSFWVCFICLGLFPLVYYAVQYEFRYRYTILWVTFLVGSLPITALAQKVYFLALQRGQTALMTRPA